MSIKKVFGIKTVVQNERQYELDMKTPEWRKKEIDDNGLN